MAESRSLKTAPPFPSRNDFSEMSHIVCIDPGHGGHDSGAVGPGGLREKDVVLSVALLLRGLLLSDCEVVMTRQADVFETLRRRAEMSNAVAADVFLSIHCNWASRRDARGFEVFTTPGLTRADRYATALFQHWQAKFPEMHGRQDLMDGDPDKEARFTVLTRTNAPAALFELEFISNPLGEDFLRSRQQQGRMAQALAAATREFLGIQPKGGCL